MAQPPKALSSPDEQRAAGALIREWRMSKKWSQQHLIDEINALLREEQYHSIAPKDIAGNTQFLCQKTQSYIEANGTFFVDKIPFYAMALKLDETQYRTLLSKCLFSMAEDMGDNVTAKTLLQTARMLTGLTQKEISLCLPNGSKLLFNRHEMFENVKLGVIPRYEELLQYDKVFHQYSDPLPAPYQWYTCDLGGGDSLQKRLWKAYHQLNNDIPETPPLPDIRVGVVTSDLSVAASHMQPGITQ